MPEIPDKSEKASLLENPKKLWGILFALVIPLALYMFYAQNKSSRHSVENPENKETSGKAVSFRPFASPASPAEQNPAMSRPLDQLTARLAKKLEANPDDVAGWTLLGRSYIVTGHPDQRSRPLKKPSPFRPTILICGLPLQKPWSLHPMGK